MRIINPDNYDFIFKVDNFPYFFNSFWLHKIYKKIDFIVANKGKTWKLYISKKDRKRLSEIGLRQLETGMSDFGKKTHNLIDQAKKLFPEIEEKYLSKYNNKQLAKDFEGFIHFVQKLWEIFFYTEYFMHDKAQEKVEKLGMNTEDYLASSPKETLVSREFYERCKLAKNPNEKGLLNHVKKYSYIHYSDGRETLTLEELKKEIREIKDPDKEIKRIDKRHKEIISKRKQNKLANGIREMAELKWLIRSFLNKTLSFGDSNLKEKYLHEISKRTGIKDFDEYHYREIIDILNGKKVVKKDRENFVLARFNNWNDILGKQALELIKILDSKKKKKSNILKGNIGNKGYYTGKVKIILFDIEIDLVKEINEMDKGDVLVTGSTGPEMIRACHKAGAIVTEEGGICSHAAIVSRELGIPAVIATEIATEVLKDRDFVEVDANKGVVRKITKQEYEKKKVKVKEVPKERLIKKTIKKVSMNGKNIVWFKDLSIKDIDIAGGKGASLGEMYDLMPVPDGFVVSAQAYEKFVEPINNKIFPILDIDVEDSAKLEKAANNVQKIILDTKIPQDIIDDIKTEYKKLGGFVACRSSATAEDLPEASFAGQQATYLNVKGDNNVVDAVKKCWASLFTARAIYYRVVNNFKHEDVLIAVVVQKMVNSQKAGVMFTVNPITNMRTEMVIEGAFGLGEMVVSGEITPDLYIVDKNKLEIKQKSVNEQEIGLFRDKEGNNVKIKVKNPAEQVLSDKQIRDLAILGVAIEKHYKKPEDIEWAVDEDDKIYILQSRPITTLK
jgi:phosphoenolpyruvate synthase/pyruvate phosphate dikinase